MADHAGAVPRTRTAGRPRCRTRREEPRPPRTRPHPAARYPTNQRAGWFYDEVAGAKGHLSRKVRYVGGRHGDAYVQRVTEFDRAVRPVRHETTIQGVEGNWIAGTYKTATHCNYDGSPSSIWRRRPT